MHNWFEKPSLSRLYKVGNLIMFAALFLIVAASLSSLHTAIALSDNLVEKSLTDIHSTMSLRLALNRYAMPVNDYIIRGSIDEKENYRILHDEVARQFQQLAAIVAENPELNNYVEESRKEWENADRVAVSIMNLRNPIGNPDAGVRMEQFDQMIDHATDILNELYDKVYKGTDKSREQLVAIEKRATILITLLSAIGIIVGIGGSIQLARLFFPPLNNMLTGIRLFGHGHLEYRIEDEMPREFNELAEGINAMAAKLESIYSDLSESSNRDHLTNCYNRRKMEEDLIRAFSQSKRTNDSLSLLMIDLDHFKGINDAYGHAAGDFVLQLAAETVRGQLRNHETLYRIGGEEFMVLLPATPATDAATVAERLRQNVERKKMDVGGDTSISVTISVGIASFPQHAASIKELLEKSDKALYQAKAAGRNRLVTSS